MTAPRTLLLLGGTGFLGTNLAQRLERAGHRVLVTGRSPIARDGRVALNLLLDDVDAVEALIQAERVGTVVHLACTMLPSSTEADYLEEVRLVTLPTVRLARRLAATGVSLAFVSSGGAVYGASTAPLAAENQRCEPISLYGQAKLELELHLLYLARTQGLRCLIVRPSNPYGPFQRLRGAQGLISVLFGRLAEGRPLEVWGDGSTVRDYIHIDDAVDAIAGLIERDVEGTVNVGSGEGHSLLDVVRVVEQVAGRPVALRFHPARPVDVPRLVLDTGLLRSLELGERRSLEDGVRRYAGQLGLARG